MAHEFMASPIMLSMIDVDQLPIPDWGLCCPVCDIALAGMEAHCCRHCGQAFNIRHLLAKQRPILDLGLRCGECDYLLTGLVENRCPECGTEFSVREMLEEQSLSGAVYLTQMADPTDHHIAKRSPTFTGRERPLPEFGLLCAQCDQSLAGAMADRCPGCGHDFDLLAIVPKGDWADVSAFVPTSLAVVAKSLLYDAEIPYLVDNAGLNHLYSGAVPFVSHRLRVPRVFFFDALNVLATSVGAVRPGAGADWTCSNCNEVVPGDFDVCWNCNASHPGRQQDHAD